MNFTVDYAAYQPPRTSARAPTTTRTATTAAPSTEGTGSGTRPTGRAPRVRRAQQPAVQPVVGARLQQRQPLRRAKLRVYALRWPRRRRRHGSGGCSLYYECLHYVAHDNNGISAIGANYYDGHTDPERQECCRNYWTYADDGDQGARGFHCESPTSFNMNFSPPVPPDTSRTRPVGTGCVRPSAARRARACGAHGRRVASYPRCEVVRRLRGCPHPPSVPPSDAPAPPPAISARPSERRPERRRVGDHRRQQRGQGGARDDGDSTLPLNNQLDRLHAAGRRRARQRLRLLAVEYITVSGSAHGGLPGRHNSRPRPGALLAAR